MTMQTIPWQDLTLKAHTIWNETWFLLTCGDSSKNHFNTMTVSWGSIGIMWNKPMVQVVVRPSRFTHEFMQTYPDFSLCAFSEEHRKALQFLGATSGRDGDKVKSSGLTACRSSQIQSPSFAEAQLVIECRKIYTDLFNPHNFLDPNIEKHYPGADYHQVYFGEVLTIRGEPQFTSGTK